MFPAVQNRTKEAVHLRETFVIQVIDTQNSTWQGVVTWAGGQKKQPFRSALELLRLIDSTLESSAEPAGEESGV